MNIESKNYQTTNPDCKGCKTFYGSEAFGGYCSSCYKKKQGNTKEDIEKTKTQKLQTKLSTPKKQQEKKEVQDIQKDRNRCHKCSRKVKNLGVQCKCGQVFCNMHRLPENHQCSFDHGGAAVKKLQKALIKVANEKLIKIE